MPKILRILITLIGAVILLGLVALIGLVIFVNPNDLKPQIDQAVTKFTGRKLQLDGDIQWTIFPWLGLQLNDAKLANIPGFSDNPFAQIKKSDIQVRLLPLLHKQLEIGKLQVYGLTLYLEKNAKGQNNWSRSFTPVSVKTPNNTNSNLLNDNLVPTGFIITGLDIRDGHIILEDLQKNRHIEVTDLQLKSANLALNKNSPFDIHFNLNTNLPNINNAVVKLRSYITLNPDTKNIKLTSLNLNALLSGPNYPNGQLPISLTSHVDLNLTNETLTADELIASINQIELTGNITGQHILTNNPTFSGMLNSPQIKLGQVTFQQVQLPFQLKNSILSVNPITAKLYEGNYQGDANIDLTTKTPHIITHSRFNQIDTQLLFQDLVNKSQIQLAGLATATMDLTTQGSSTESLIKNSQGKGRFYLSQGAIKGINISYWIAFGKALLKHQEKPQSNGNDTLFDKFSGSFTINQGLVTNNDLIIQSGRLRVNGQGNLDLPQQQINYQLHAQPILADGSPEGMAIPLKISGPLQHITISPILDQLGVDFLKEKLKQRLGDSLKKLDLGKIFH